MARSQMAMARLRAVVAIIAVDYGVLIILYIITRLIVGEQWVVVEIANSLTPAILLPVCLLLPLILLLRRWRIALILMPTLILLMVHYAPFFVPARQPAPTEAVRVRVLTFNLGSFITDYPRIIALIRSADADIISLQELLTPSAEQLVAALADTYPYQALHASDNFAKGVGIFSKFPIERDSFLDQLLLGGQQTHLMIDDTQVVSILNVHPTAPRIGASFDSSRRSQEIDTVLRVAAAETLPVLLIGDFNITDLNDDYAKIATGYSDAFYTAGSGFGLTFPNLARFASPLGVLPPLLRIDYIFYDAHWVALDAYVMPDHGGSDHYPLVAELAFRQSAPG